MSENKWWDPKAHTSGSFLEGKRGVIKDAEFVRNNCKGHCPERTVLQFRLELPDVAPEKQPFPVQIGFGKEQYPSVDGASKELSGPKLYSPTGKGVSKKSVGHFFLVKLAASGFPMEKFGEVGAAALNGADVTMGALDRTYTIENETKESTYDVVTQFHGFVEVAGGAAAEATPEDETDAIAQLSEVLLAALAEHNGEIPRGQLSIRLNKGLKENPNRVKLLGMVTKDDVLGQIEGITFDKKTVKLA